MLHELRENRLTSVHPSLSATDDARPAVFGSHFSPEKVQIEKSQKPR
jgi:hypothetical protein